MEGRASNAAAGAGLVEDENANNQKQQGEAGKSTDGARGLESVTLPHPVEGGAWERLLRSFGKALQLVPAKARKSAPAAHPELAAARLCVARMLRQYAGTRKAVLYVQHTDRFGDRANDVEACRVAVTADDYIDLACGEERPCRHRVGLNEGRYSAIAFLDCPITPDTVTHIFSRYPYVQNIYAGLHVYGNEHVSIADGEMRAQWQAAIDETPGSAGEFAVSISGHPTIVEPDHHWLQAQNGPPGTIVERLARYVEYAYAIYRVSRRAAASPVVLTTPHSVWGNSDPHLTVVGNSRVWVFGAKFCVVELGERRGARRVPVPTEWLQSTYNKLLTTPVLDSEARRRAGDWLRQQIKNTDGTADPASILAAAEVFALSARASQQVDDLLPFTRTWYGRWVPKRSADLIAAFGTAVQQRELWCAKLTRWFFYLLILAAVAPWPQFNCVMVERPRPIVQYREYTMGFVTVSLPTTTWERVFVWHELVEECSIGLGNYAWSTLTPRAGLAVAGLTTWCSLPMASAQNVVPTLYEQVESDPTALIGIGGSYPINSPIPALDYVGEYKTQAPTSVIQISDDAIVEPGVVTKIGCYLVGLAFTLHPNVYAPNACNMVASARNRQIADMPGFDEVAFGEFEDRFIADLSARDGMEAEFVVPSFEEWNARFPQKQQERHREALRKVAADGLDDDFREMFPKKEKLILLPGEKHKDPRTIIGGSDEVSVTVGPTFYGLKNKSLEVNHPMAPVFYACSQKADELETWASRTDERRAVCGDDQIAVVARDDGWVVIEIDGKRHDAHMHAGFHHAKWRAYRVYGMPDADGRMAWFCEQQKCTRAGTKSRTVRIKFDYRVRSGDHDTTIGNTIVTDGIQGEAVMIAKIGDRRTIGERIKNQLLRLGYEVDIRVHDSLHTATFLSGRFYPVAGRVLWGPMPGRQLVKLGWMLDNHGSNTTVKWAGVVKAYDRYLFVPFLRVYVAHVRQLLGAVWSKAERQRDGFYVKAHEGAPQEPDEETWNMFYNVYGLGPADEEEFKKQLQRATSLPFIVDSPFVVDMAEVDA